MPALKGIGVCRNTETWGINLPETKAGAHNPFLAEWIGLAHSLFYRPRSHSLIARSELPNDLKPQPRQASATRRVCEGWAILNKCCRERRILFLSRLLVTPVAHSVCPSLFPPQQQQSQKKPWPPDRAWSHGHVNSRSRLRLLRHSLRAPAGSDARCQGAMCKPSTDLARQHIEL